MATVDSIPKKKKLLPASSALTSVTNGGLASQTDTAINETKGTESPVWNAPASMSAITGNNNDKVKMPTGKITAQKHLDGTPYSIYDPHQNQKSVTPPIVTPPKDPGTWTSSMGYDYKPDINHYYNPDSVNSQYDFNADLQKWNTWVKENDIYQEWIQNQGDLMGIEDEPPEKLPVKPPADPSNTFQTDTTIRPWDGETIVNDDVIWGFDNGGMFDLERYNKDNVKIYRVGNDSPFKGGAPELDEFVPEIPPDNSDGKSTSSTKFGKSIQLATDVFTDDLWLKSGSEGSHERIQKFYESLEWEDVKTPVAFTNADGTVDWKIETTREMTGESSEAHGEFVRLMKESLDRASLGLQAGVHAGTITDTNGKEVSTVEVIKEYNRTSEILSEYAGRYISPTDVEKGITSVMKEGDDGSFEESNKNLIDINNGYKLASENLRSELNLLNLRNTELQANLNIKFTPSTVTGGKTDWSTGGYSMIDPSAESGTPKELASLQAEWQTTRRRLEQIDKALEASESENTLLKQQVQRGVEEADIFTDSYKERRDTITVNLERITAEKVQLEHQNKLLAAEIVKSKQENFINFVKDAKGNTDFKYMSGETGAPAAPGIEFAKLQSQWELNKTEIDRMSRFLEEGGFEEQQVVQLKNENNIALKRMEVIWDQETGYTQGGEDEYGEALVGGVELGQLQTSYLSNKANTDLVANQVLEASLRNAILFDPEKGFSGGIVDAETGETGGGGLALANAQAAWAVTQMEIKKATRDLELSEEEQAAIKDYFPELENFGKITTPRLLEFAAREKDRQRDVTIATNEIEARKTMATTAATAQTDVATTRATADKDIADTNLLAQQAVANARSNADIAIANANNQNKTLLAALQNPFNFEALKRANPGLITGTLIPEVTGQVQDIGTSAMQSVSTSGVSTDPPAYTLNALKNMQAMQLKQYVANQAATGVSEEDLYKLAGGVSPCTQQATMPVQVVQQGSGRGTY